MTNSALSTYFVITDHKGTYRQGQSFKERIRLGGRDVRRRDVTYEMCEMKIYAFVASKA